MLPGHPLPSVPTALRCDGESSDGQGNMQHEVNMPRELVAHAWNILRAPLPQAAHRLGNPSLPLADGYRWRPLRRLRLSLRSAQNDALRFASLGRRASHGTWQVRLRTVKNAVAVALPIFPAPLLLSSQAPSRPACSFPSPATSDHHARYAPVLLHSACIACAICAATEPSPRVYDARSVAQPADDASNGGYSTTVEEMPSGGKHACCL